MVTRAFVFGGSEGIGLSVAARLVAKGADVVVLSRSPAKLDAALALLGPRPEHPATAVGRGSGGLRTISSAPQP
ncbi:hypothetical protein GCM10022237_28860 [Nocardioides ginsengisoli]|uniref:SDR family NAD(P)-dependent oxidoreductase n=1 Tax=Nocardioides ginsengisoli TaxID=363868 RepID=A0ABW3W2U2_9ACTN